MKMTYRLIAAKWAIEADGTLPKAIEGQFSQDQLDEYNARGYNIYFLPNYPSQYTKGAPIAGSDIDVFDWCFVDMDLKDGVYGSKEAFLETVGAANLPPTKIVDSGNGVHVYWKVANLDPMSYLRFQRRLMRLFNTDEAVGQLFQLMRLPGSINVKNQDALVPCILLYENDTTYTAEDFDKLLPAIELKDEQYCQQHYDKTNGINQTVMTDDTVPAKFGALLSSNHEAKKLWADTSDDRSKSDYRLGHIMIANGFTKEEAIRVLYNSAKASERAPIHRQNYAQNIVDKIWTYEVQSNTTERLDLSESVEQILARSGDTIKGVPFRCHPRIDNTAHGFRLGQVIGLVGGSGIGKTAFGLNMFKWFIESNPDYDHFFIPLEQPANEIADRWKSLCGDDTTLNKKVHVLSNYDADGNFRHLSFDEIRIYIEKWQKETGKKVGCVVIDHIGALKKKGSNDENQDLMTICHAMKAFAVQTNTLLVMQSQTSREKAGIGDLELDKGAAYGTSTFEWYVDYLITMWQPLKRCHSEPSCPTVTAFKYCKIRHKKARQDVIQEDVPYFLYFDSDRESLRDMTQDEKTSFNYYLPQATNKRKADRKTEIVSYQSVPYKEGQKNGTETDDNSNSNSSSRAH